MKWLLKAYACKDRSLLQHQLAEWYSHQLGQTLATIEQELIDEVLSNLFGYHLLQLGDVIPRDLLSASRVSHRVVMTEGERSRYSGSAEGVFAGLPEQMPVENDSIDVVLCPHILEFSRTPHEVLREVERVLIPEGYLVLLSFNPWSSWGLTRALLGWQRRPPWCGRYYSSGRLRDWLSLLGFDTVITRSAFYRLPVNHAGLLERFAFVEQLGQRWWPPFGGVQLIVAQKRVATLTPIKPRWRPRRSLLQGKVPEATVRRDKQ